MNDTNSQLSFWRLMGRGLNDGLPIVSVLENIAGAIDDETLADAARTIRDRLYDGLSLSQALSELPAVFAPAIVQAVDAGEQNAILDIAVEKIASAFESDNFDGLVESIAGTATPAQGDADAIIDDAAQAAFFQSWGDMLSNGVPFMASLDRLSKSIPDTRIQDVITTIRSKVHNGGTIASALKSLSGQFHERVIAALEAGEETGKLDSMLGWIADALTQRKVSSLPGEGRSQRRDETITLNENAPPVIKIVNRILLEAVKRGADEIHIDPPEEDAGESRTRLRIDGILRPIDPVPANMYHAAVSRIKIMSQLDVAEKRLPQDGRIDMTIKDERYRMRVSVLPSAFGERVALRFFKRFALLSLADLGLLDDDLETIRDLCQRPSGLTLLAGPTGSGVTTLLYAMLQEQDARKQCVITIENPIEAFLPGVIQTQPHPGRGLTIASLIRSALRGGVDTLAVSDIRDLESCQLLVRAAMSGKRVFSVIHTPSGPDTLRRLIDLGLEPYLLNATLNAVISHRLVRKLCPACRRPAQPDVNALSPVVRDFIDTLKEPKFFEPTGCDACSMTGYSGRTGLVEIMRMSDPIRRALADDALADQKLRNAARAAGMKTLLENGLEKAARGLTSLTEVLAYGMR